MSDDKPTEEPSDEEKALESIRSPRSVVLDNRLSTVSQQYDRGNKGYLDSTELQLRKMDSKNQGFLEVDKVYMLMEQFQKEQKKSLNLKRAVIALSCFAVLLALANIGTSFAAAKLAKDTVVDPTTGALMVKGTSIRVGVDGRVAVFKVAVENEHAVGGGRERFLQVSINGNGSNGSFTVSRSRVEQIFSTVCCGFTNFASFDLDTFSCGTVATCDVEHCSRNWLTTLSYVEAPYVSGSDLIMRFDATRGDWKYGQVTITCAADGTGLCAVEGLTCERDCSVCSTGPSGVARWWCPGAQQCGCFPDSDPPCVDSQPACTRNCWIDDSASKRARQLFPM